MSGRKRPPFATIPEWLLYDATVSPLALRVYAVIDRHADKDDGQAHPGVERIAELLGVSEGSVRRATAELRSAGALRVERRGLGLTNRYTVLFWPDTEGESDDLDARMDRAPMRGLSGTTCAIPREREPEEREQEINPIVEQGSTDARRIFDSWVGSLGPGARRQFTDDRRKRIVRALKHYPVEDLVLAVEGWKFSPHHRGENDRATAYNDLELLLRDAKHIEMFRDLTLGHRPSQGMTRSRYLPEHLRSPDYDGPAEKPVDA